MTEKMNFEICIDEGRVFIRKRDMLRIMRHSIDHAEENNADPARSVELMVSRLGGDIDFPEDYVPPFRESDIDELIRNGIDALEKDEE